MSLTEAETAARKACEALIARTTVLLVTHRDLRQEPEWGSGVLLQNSRGVPFVVTARHLFCDHKKGWATLEWRPLSIFVPLLAAAELAGGGEEVAFAPGRTPEDPVDVALVTVRRDMHDRLRPLAVGIERIAQDDAVDEKDVVFMCGFPAFLAFPEANVRQVATISYITGVTGHDGSGRLEVDWDEAVPYQGNRLHPHLNYRPGEAFKLGHPRGISGGGVWRVRGSSEGELIWSPSSHQDLIGVPVAFDKHRTQYAESAAAWGPWLREAAEKLG